MFRIRSDVTDWVVVADWLGAPRVVFRGDVFECCRFVRDNRGGA